MKFIKFNAPEDTTNISQLTANESFVLVPDTTEPLFEVIHGLEALFEEYVNYGVCQSSYKKMYELAPGLESFEDRNTFNVNPGIKGLTFALENNVGEQKSVIRKIIDYVINSATTFLKWISERLKVIGDWWKKVRANSGKPNSKVLNFITRIFTNKKAFTEAVVATVEKEQQETVKEKVNASVEKYIAKINTKFNVLSENPYAKYAYLNTGGVEEFFNNFDRYALDIDRIVGIINVLTNTMVSASGVAAQNSLRGLLDTVNTKLPQEDWFNSRVINTGKYSSYKIYLKDKEFIDFAKRSKNILDTSDVIKNGENVTKSLTSLIVTLRKDFLDDVANAYSKLDPGSAGSCVKLSTEVLQKTIKVISSIQNEYLEVSKLATAFLFIDNLFTTVFVNDTVVMAQEVMDGIDGDTKATEAFFKNDVGVDVNNRTPESTPTDLEKSAIEPTDGKGAESYSDIGNAAYGLESIADNELEFPNLDIPRFGTYSIANEDDSDKKKSVIRRLIDWIWGKIKAVKDWIIEKAGNIKKRFLAYKSRDTKAYAQKHDTTGFDPDKMAKVMEDILSGVQKTFDENRKAREARYSAHGDNLTKQANSTTTTVNKTKVDEEPQLWKEIVCSNIKNKIKELNKKYIDDNAMEEMLVYNTIETEKYYDQLLIKTKDVTSKLLKVIADVIDQNKKDNFDSAVVKKSFNELKEVFINGNDAKDATKVFHDDVAVLYKTAVINQGNSKFSLKLVEDLIERQRHNIIKGKDKTSELTHLHSYAGDRIKEFRNIYFSGVLNNYDNMEEIARLTTNVVMFIGLVSKDMVIFNTALVNIDLMFNGVLDAIENEVVVNSKGEIIDVAKFLQDEFGITKKSGNGIENQYEQQYDDITDIALGIESLADLELLQYASDCKNGLGIYSIANEDNEEKKKSVIMRFIDWISKKLAAIRDYIMKKFKSIGDRLKGFTKKDKNVANRIDETGLNSDKINDKIDDVVKKTNIDPAKLEEFKKQSNGEIVKLIDGINKFVDGKQWLTNLLYCPAETITFYVDVREKLSELNKGAVNLMEAMKSKGPGDIHTAHDVLKNYLRRSSKVSTGDYFTNALKELTGDAQIEKKSLKPKLSTVIDRTAAQSNSMYMTIIKSVMSSHEKTIKAFNELSKTYTDTGKVEGIGGFDEAFSLLTETTTVMSTCLSYMVSFHESCADLEEITKKLSAGIEKIVDTFPKEYDGKIKNYIKTQLGVYE